MLGRERKKYREGERGRVKGEYVSKSKNGKRHRALLGGVSCQIELPSERDFFVGLVWTDYSVFTEFLVIKGNDVGRFVF